MAMTMTQKILADHAGMDSVVAGQLIEAKLDVVMANDITGPMALPIFRQMADKVFDKDKVVLVPDHFTPNKDIKSVEDMKGLKVRVMQNKYHIEAWKNMGAAPTPMDWGEVYVGLQQKMIDAVENPYFFICSSKLYEVQDHILETEHLPQPAALFMSEESFQNLPEDVQKLVLECGEIAKVKTREVSDTMLADRIQEIKDHGVTITKPSDEMLNQLREMVKPSNELIHQDVGDEFYATFSNYLEQTRNAK